MPCTNRACSSLSPGSPVCLFCFVLLSLWLPQRDSVDVQAHGRSYASSASTMSGSSPTDLLSPSGLSLDALSCLSGDAESVARGFLHSMPFGTHLRADFPAALHLMVSEGDVPQVSLRLFFNIAVAAAGYPAFLDSMLCFAFATREADCNLRYIPLLTPKWNMCTVPVAVANCHLQRRPGK